MSQSMDEGQWQKIERILVLMRQLPPDIAQALVERWTWELDEYWHREGIPVDIEQKIDKARKRFDKQAAIDEKD